MTNYIAYYRVSTDKQGTSGLGLEAQQDAVKHFTQGKPLLSEYIEIESGKQDKNRPQLIAALAECKKRKATLIIAKLDRLGRNVAFISTLMESATEFVCCDNPHANKLMIHMLAAFAEHEREMISKRTKEALQAAKRRGVKLGNPKIEAAQAIAAQSHAKQRPDAATLALLQTWRQQGKTLAQCANELTAIKPAPRGGKWYASTVNNMLLRGNSF